MHPCPAPPPLNIQISHLALRIELNFCDLIVSKESSAILITFKFPWGLPFFTFLKLWDLLLMKTPSQSEWRIGWWWCQIIWVMLNSDCSNFFLDQNNLETDIFAIFTWLWMPYWSGSEIIFKIELLVSEESKACEPELCVRLLEFLKLEEMQNF